MDRSKNEEVAYHEAGHAVVGYILGCRLTRVTIARTDDYLGACFFEGADLLPKTDEELFEWQQAEGDGGEPVEDRIKRGALFDCAGPAAEYLYTSSYPEGHWGSDFTPYLGALVGSAEEEEELVRALTQHAEKLLRDNWAAVEALARVLLEQEEVNGEYAMALIRDSGSPLRLGSL